MTYIRLSLEYITVFNYHERCLDLHKPELIVSETDILDINQSEEQDTLSINIIIVNLFNNLLYIILLMLNKDQYIYIYIYIIL